MTHAFLSYVRENSADVDYVAAALRANGVKVWIDRNDIEAGCFWKDAIARAIQSGAYFIAFFSKTSLERNQTYMNEELTLALEQLRIRPHDSRWFIPVLIDDVKIPQWPFRPGQSLRDFQAVQLFASREAGVAYLLNGLGYDDPAIAEEKLLTELLKSRFPLQREHARDQLCSSKDLSAESRFALVDAVFNEPINSMQMQGVDLVLDRLGNDDHYAIASRIASHPNSEIRRLAYKHFFNCRTDQALIVKHALIAIGDQNSLIRYDGIEFLNGKLRHFPEAVLSVAALLRDHKPNIRSRAVSTMLDVSDLWVRLPPGDFGIMARILFRNPHLWEQFGQFAALNQPVPRAFRGLLKRMAASENRGIQNLALELVPNGRANFVAKKIRELRGHQIECAVMAANRLGFPENRSVKAIAALEAAARSDARAAVRNASHHALNTHVGLGKLPIQADTHQIYSEPVWQRSVRIVNIRGLDAREAAKFTTLALEFDANVSVSRQDAPEDMVGASSIMGLMMLGAARGDSLIVSAAGPEAIEALVAIIAFIEDGMGGQI